MFLLDQNGNYGLYLRTQLLQLMNFSRKPFPRIVINLQIVTENDGAVATDITKVFSEESYQQGISLLVIMPQVLKVVNLKLSIRAGGVGLTLTAASTVIFAELAWTPGDLIQAEDRVHRIGQVSSVNIHYLLANDTVDDIIWDVVQSKLENLGQMLDGHEETLEVSRDENQQMVEASNRHGTKLWNTVDEDEEQQQQQQQQHKLKLARH
ncbi:DNA annealing helicase and endonuclease ZRANB3 [Linum perenne]